MADLKAKQIKFPLTGTSVVSSSAQIASNISGSFTAASSSFSTRVTTTESELGNTLISSSAQIASNISGSFTAASSSFSTRVTTAESELGNTLISSSAQIASNISGSVVNPSGNISGSSLSTGSFGRVEIGAGGIDTTGDITLDGDGGDIILKDGGTEFGRFTNIIGGLTLRTGPGANSAIVFGTGSNPAVIVGGEITTSHNISGSSTTTGSFGKLIIAEMGNQDVTSVSSSISTRLSTAETELSNTLISSSAQIASNISGSFTTPSASFSTRVSDVEAGSTSKTLVSSSAQIASDISGSLSTTSLNALGLTLVSGSAQIASNISGSFIAASSSFSTRVTTAESELSNTLISSSAQIASNISGSFTAASSSFSTRVTNTESELSNTLISSSAQIASNISGSFTTPSASFSTRVTAAESELSNTLISSSAQIASNISGSFTTPSASFSTRITTAESELSNTLISSSAQIASNISGSFTTPSASFSTRITTAESELSNTLVSSSAQIASNISGSLSTTSLNALGLTLVSSSAQIASNISGSSTSLSASLSGRIGATEAGEITGVTAGTGLSGGGTSGAITLNVDFTDSTLKSNISGSFTAASSSFSTRVTTAESELSNTLVSSSAQIASNISGSFTAASSSFSTRVTTAESELSNTLFSSSAQVDHDSTTNFVANEHINHTSVSITAGDGLTGGGTIASTRTLAVGEGTGVTVNANDVAIGQDVATNANVTFASITTTGNVEAEGDVIARNYIVSSSVTHMTSSIMSGSTRFGDTPADDTHQFTGSLFITGSAPTDITTTNSIFVGNDITGSVISGSSLLGVVGTATQGTINHDSLAGFVANEHIDHSGVTLTAGDGLSGGGDITTNRSFAVGAAQTTITSIINSSLGKIGTAADQEYITFGTSNEVNTFVNNSERLSVTNTGVDITGNLDTSATGSFGHISSTGVIRTTSIISGSTLESTGDLTLDSSGDIILDADGTDIILKDGGTEFGRFKIATSDFVIKSAINNKDILFKGVDASSTITALKLDMSEGGNAQFLGNISGSQIEASGDVIAFGSSDERLKDNIQPISEPLYKLSKVGGYTFDWNDKQDAYQGHDVGVIAQEIEEILPEVVTTRGTGYKAVKYEKIVPLLIESIKELQKKVEDIEKKCDCLNK